MKLKDIFTDFTTKVFKVTNDDNENELLWTITPTNFLLVPDDEETYFIKAVQTLPTSTINCFISIVTPERIADYVIKLDTNRQAILESFHEQENSTIPLVASECFGDYELYYSKENPQIGIDILKQGMTNAINKNVVAEDLGYILRDEELTQEAIEAFLISEQIGPSSEFIYSELSQLYELLEQTDKQNEYKQKYYDNGGVDFDN